MNTLLLLPFLFLQPKSDSQIVTIRDKVTYTNNHLKDFSQKQINHPEGISTEGGVTVSYWSNDSLKLISDETYAESGKTIAYYYFENGQLIFAFIINYDYNVPFYLKEFDWNKSARNEERYYLNNQTIVKWIDEKGKTHLNPRLSSTDLIAEARQLMKRFF